MVLGRAKRRDMVGAMQSNAPRIILLSAVLAALSASSAMACSVPVFRYALERWAPDPFTATIFHRGTLTSEQSKIVAALDASEANLGVVQVDLDAEEDAALLETWAEQESDTLPWLYVTYPKSHPVAVELASGPLETRLAEAVLDTPVRSEIGKRLAGGQTAVWVLLESGDAARDDAAWKSLQSEIARLESTLELPVIEQEDIDAGLLSLDEDELKIAFSAVRLARDNSADEMFVRMLLDIEVDLLDLREPMVFPVFGRGRALYSLVGDGITPENLEVAAAYLVGACSCQVKADNPGVDLLMAIAWDDLVESTLDSTQQLPELAGILSEPPEPESPVPAAAVSTSPAPPEPLASPGSTLPASEAGSERVLWTTLSAFVGMLLLVGLGSVLFQRKDETG